MPLCVSLLIFQINKYNTNLNINASLMGGGGVSEGASKITKGIL